MKRLLLTFLAGLFAVVITAQPSARQELRKNVQCSAGNSWAYPIPTQQKLTPAPAGKRPFYMSHIGRHGSRYQNNSRDYRYALDMLEKADSRGMLSNLGKDVMKRLRLIYEDAQDRLGELSPLGAQQQKEVASRMVKNFPELFEGDAMIDAHSTSILRCVFSMENTLQQLIAINPKLRIRHDASEHDMWYMNHDDKRLKDHIWNPELRKVYNDFKARHANYDRVMQTLFNDTAYVRHEVNAENLNYHLFKLASNIQSSELRHSVTLYDLFTADEIYDNWMIENAGWYIGYGPCPMNGALQPFSQRHLLGKIIEEADQNVGKSHPGATLRYGHEVCVMPLACLLELDNCGKQIYDLEKLPEEGWLNYKIFPMGCNIQLIFYKPKKRTGDILVKVLLNENEATLPLKPVTGPYYKWTDFRDYFSRKLANFKLAD